ncbi:ADP-ribosyltransferase domain-containing protein [Pokkaliibacter sp. MBI-7]|uniref:ADP-ribosyltransferase domain-containing protein n=1 Tax=Pokkaliibacter sp. MBI-7 TaxID=3040600 RepID=UPI00244CD830|nr:ADP-ribosyltransferase domain-containing protein [Pokkaliibacter sp. MBI-7]MDH2433903.1 ADP-ribosyltransferase domain-containing protein [Pokkaliibacter sp. MBI-7]
MALPPINNTHTPSTQTPTQTLAGLALPQPLAALAKCFLDCFRGQTALQQPPVLVTTQQQLSHYPQQVSPKAGSSKLASASRGDTPSRLTDTPVKQALHRVIREERMRLACAGELSMANLPRAEQLIRESLAVKDRTASAAKLSDDEFLAVRLYTTNLYPAINHHLRYQHNDKVVPVVGALQQGLQKLAASAEHRADGQLYRGISKNMSDEEVHRRFSPERPYRDSAFMSTSLNAQKAFIPGTRVELTLSSSSAVNIKAFAQHKDEEEALIPPDTPFQVQQMEKHEGVWQIRLKEMQEQEQEPAQNVQATETGSAVSGHDQISS